MQLCDEDVDTGTPREDDVTCSSVGDVIWSVTSAALCLPLESEHLFTSEIWVLLHSL